MHSASIVGHFNGLNDGTSIAHGPQFRQTMATLRSKDLKKQGKGNKSMAADAISDAEIDRLYACGELENHNPRSLINTLWFNTTTHFGKRGGGTEHRQLMWGDIQLGIEGTEEFLEFNERQTNPGLVVIQIMYADKNPGCMPLALKGAQWLHTNTDDHPFYLAVVTNKVNPADHEQWFVAAPIGRNKLDSIMKTMAERAELPALMNGKRLTNTSARKRLCQKLLQSNVPDTQAILITGHKNEGYLNNYRVLPNDQRQSISN
ncbi:LOW QUALITY PROTEIN: hypothetical protein MAR_013034 [Mya arenaria]|uniref:DUF3504 domain-containing protein n=1 Tax=Mya arenaria TaxID=6604 RepID=A0ABY7FZE5_MYAAR|nr:LOW QUALITY PROTEIN: hypothetical protein MAR_013034 [Mya arenaria]